MVRPEEVLRLYRNGRQEEARTLATAWDPERNDPAYHAEWAYVFDQIGQTERAVAAWQRAVEIDPRVDWLEQLADLLIDLDRADDAVPYLEQAVRAGTDRVQTYLLLGEILESAQRDDDARAVYHTGWERTRAPVLRHRMDALSETAAPSEVATVLGRIPTQEDALSFLQYFQGREGVYARQWVDPSGRVGYQPVREPLTPGIALRHLQGDITVGVYPVRVDNTVYFIAWDIDINRSVLRACRNDPDRLAEHARAAHDAAVQLVEFLHDADLPCMLEDSGYKGRHVWLFFRTPMDAGIARTIGQTVARLHPLPSGLHYEIFPRQAELAPDQLGNLIKIPLGIHRRTGRRCLFLQTDGTAILQPLDALFACTRLDPEPVVERARSWQKTAVTVPMSSEPLTVEEREAREIIAVEQPTYYPEADPEFQTLTTFCAALRALVEKARHTHQLTYDEQLVIVHTFGYLTHGVDAVNTILDECVNAYAQLRLKSPLRGNPMSCPKIRQRIPHITRAYPCECPNQPELGYPTPVLFLRMRDTMPAEEWDQMEIEQVAGQWLDLTRRSEEIRIHLERLTERLRTYFQQSGDRELRIGNVCIRMNDRDELEWQTE